MSSVIVTIAITLTITINIMKINVQLAASKKIAITITLTINITIIKQKEVAALIRKIRIIRITTIILRRIIIRIIGSLEASAWLHTLHAKSIIWQTIFGYPIFGIPAQASGGDEPVVEHPLPDGAIPNVFH